MNRTWLTIEPLDVLILRGNRLFGGAVHGEALMPPWPSVIAGAILTMALADQGRLLEVVRNPSRALLVAKEIVGKDFALTLLGLLKDGKVCFPLPSDIFVVEEGDGEARSYQLRTLKPVPRPKDVRMSNPLTCILVSEKGERKKPIGGFWINEEDLSGHLNGKQPESHGLISVNALWSTESRLGIALGKETNTVETGAIYTTDVVILKPGVKMVACFNGNNIPESGLLRLGGDGRGCVVKRFEASETLKDLGCPRSGWTSFRMILSTPGIFPKGWLAPGVDEENMFRWGSMKAKLIAAFVPRAGIISGWDMANHAPKPALKIVPHGTCYWFKVLEGDTAELKPLWESGLWPLIGSEQEISTRRYEGWNNVWFGKANF